jgi:hypothetical protein
MRLIFILLITVNSLTSLAGFEGVITSTIFNQGQSVEVKWFIKEDMLKLSMGYEGESGPITAEFIVKKGEETMTVITTSAAYNGFSEINKSTISGSLNIHNLFFQKTETTSEDVVKYQAKNSQYNCAIWQKEIDIQLGAFSAFFQDDPAFVLLEQLGLSGFPEKVLLTNHNGELIYASTVINIEQRQLSSSDFSIPEGYQKREPVEMEIAK